MSHSSEQYAGQVRSSWDVLGRRNIWELSGIFKHDNGNSSPFNEGIYGIDPMDVNRGICHGQIKDNPVASGIQRMVLSTVP